MFKINAQDGNKKIIIIIINRHVKMKINKINERKEKSIIFSVFFSPRVNFCLANKFG